jgi:hypothetical protein
VLAQLKWLDLNGSQITDDGCAQLASWLLSGAMPPSASFAAEGAPCTRRAPAWIAIVRDTKGFTVQGEDE